jgi:Gamma-thionin family
MAEVMIVSESRVPSVPTGPQRRRGVFRSLGRLGMAFGAGAAALAGVAVAPAPTADAALCRRRSQTWSGFCGSSDACKDQCIRVERAVWGACHRQGIGRACFCYFNC